VGGPCSEGGVHVTVRRWITTKEAARITGLAEATVRATAKREGWASKPSSRPTLWDLADVAKTRAERRSIKVAARLARKHSL